MDYVTPSAVAETFVATGGTKAQRTPVCRFADAIYAFRRNGILALLHGLAENALAPTTSRRACAL